MLEQNKSLPGNTCNQRYKCSLLCHQVRFDLQVSSLSPADLGRLQGPPHKDGYYASASQVILKDGRPA